MTQTNINFTHKKYAGAPTRKLSLAGTPAQPRFAPLQLKKYQAQKLGGPWM